MGESQANSRAISSFSKRTMMRRMTILPIVSKKHLSSLKRERMLNLQLEEVVVARKRNHLTRSNLMMKKM